MFQHQFLLPARRTRCYSQSLAGIAPNVAQQSTAPVPMRYAYYVRRNTRGSIPVYTELRNTKHMTLIRNVEGDLSVSPWPAPPPRPG
ncbi:hypothetical protein PHLCEN_2v4557 [Hermanssonia centrifuga]|uniref:Large ribosomal subunit protein mL49 n=1 Tax=Hermanssonia centrifuga TaxID=98765 RepID=A0A2R6PNE2_9APHY|nr:hypothetical protein PHLCEN_2v4557 [Hermanssonia centrifuga]